MFKTSMLFAALFALTLAITADAFAQSRGTPSEQRACNGDARRLCRSAVSSGDEDAVYSCLQRNRSRLSAACRKVLAGR